MDNAVTGWVPSLDAKQAVRDYATEYAQGEPLDGEQYPILQTAIDGLLTAVVLEILRAYLGFHALIPLVFAMLGISCLALHLALSAGGWAWRTRKGGRTGL